MQKKRYTFFILMLFVACACAAQRLKVTAPSHVMMGENLKLMYTINTQDVDEIRLGNIPGGFELIAGPYQSSQSSYQIINGHASSSSSTTFTYILSAVKEGTFKIPAAYVVADGHKVASQPVQIKVSGKSANNGGAPRMHGSNDDISQLKPSGSSIGDRDLFIKVSANKKSVYEQEPVVLTYKVYTLVDLNDLNGKMPDLTGFHTLEVPQPQQRSFHVENYNGRAYRCVTWSQYIMYPQMSGKLKIPSITFKGSVVQQNRAVDPLEAFFNGGSAYVEVKRNIVAPELTLDVQPLPTKPAGFSGGVGTFNVSAQLNKNDLKANEPFTIRVVVSGVGNLKLLKQPTIKFPKDFDKYDPKVTDKTKITANGLEGSMVYDFIAVPHNQGKYTIPAVEFVYFDTQQKAYKTIKTQAFQLDIKPGTGNGGTSVTDYGADLKNKDIRPIKEGATSLRSTDDVFYSTPAYWTIVVLILLLSAITFFALRKYIEIGNDLVRNRRKSANRVAFKRMRKANDFRLQGQRAEFYEEVLKAMWGYAEEKFNLSADELKRENVGNVMRQNGIPDDVAARFIDIIDLCEMEHYSPSTVGNMDTVFEDSMNVITSVEDNMKKNKRGAKATLLLLLLCLMTIPASAVTKANADEEYKKGNYQQAIKDYNELLKGGVSADIYYNLGNAYYRSDNMTYAILSYERALLLAPSNDDIAFNLQLARSKTIDKITPEPKMFFVKWWNAVVTLVDTDTWAVVTLVSLFAAAVMFLVYSMSHRLLVRQIGFYAGAVLLAVFIVGNVCAYTQKRNLQERRGAIVTVTSLQMMKVPDAKGSAVAVIHEGTRVDIIDDSMKQWKCVRLGDNREGWVRASQIERI